MAVPKKKTSKSRRNMRRAHDALSNVLSIECENCGINRLPHNVCLGCGMYRGKQIITVKELADEDDYNDDE